MKKRIVLALGGNALGNNFEEQTEACKITATAIADLVQDGHEVVLSHGNGPQVGMINLAFETASKIEAKLTNIPIAFCGAMSQGYIGFSLQNALREELLNRGINKPVVSLVSQSVVDPKDPAFENPTKPIGAFYTEEEAKEMTKQGAFMKEDAGRGYRHMIASPKPIDIVEKETVKALLEAGQIVIAGGGGGIPVAAEGNSLKDVAAVIDKDFNSCKLAELINADILIILTAVEKVAVNFNKPDVKWLDTMNVAEAEAYIKEGQFAPGSMLPKVEAAIRFVQSGPNRSALITLLEKAKEGINGETGTLVTV